MKVIIIGAGIAGIASAIRLRLQGHEIHVYEANSYPGGKLSAFGREGYRFDAGPSLFTMPQYVEELFALAGKDMAPYLQYKRLPIVCNYFWEDQTRLSAYADTEDFAYEVEDKLGVSRHGLYRAIEDSQLKYELTGTIFMNKPLNKLSTWLSWDVVKALLKLNKLHVFKNMNAVNESLLNHPKLVQLFNRYATYNGSNPYEAPGILTIIPHLEHHFGAYIPKGGMHDITLALARLAAELGVVFHYNARVEEILVENKRAVGIRLGDYNKIMADRIVSNADVWHTYRRLLPSQKAPEKVLKQQRSSSALIFYWGIKNVFPELNLHNIFFSDDYKKEFETIFKDKDIYADPTVYVNITSKFVLSDAPKDCENWFVMINVPNNEGQDWDEITSRARYFILKKLSRILDTPIEPLIVCEDVLDPRTIESRTSSYQGSLYGTSSNSRYAAFLRHANASSDIKGLFFCGGSAHPGGGIPLCLLSAKIMSDVFK